MQHRTRGWYPDPMHIGVIRRWDGNAWTDDVMWGSRRYVDETPLHQVLVASTEQDARVVRAYIHDAASRGVLIPSLAARLEGDLDTIVAAARTGGWTAAPVSPARSDSPTADTAATTAPATPPAPPAAATPAAPPAAAPPAVATPAATRPTTGEPAPVPHPAPARPQARPAPEPPARPFVAPVLTPAEPGPVARWWAGTRSTLKSDLAVHGLAYLGVVLLFAGVFGLIAFSFGDVARGWRLVALVAAPSACFLAGWYLGRRGASAVSSALTILGAAVLPVAAVASVTDGATPDVRGTALPITQAVLCALIAGGELALLRRVPVLRWVVAPTLWLGAGLLLGVTRDPIPSGEAVVRANALQIAGIVAAIALTLVVTVRSPRSALARATTALGLPLAAALVVLEALIAAGEGWPAWSGVIVAVAAVVIVECTPRLGAWTAPLQTALLAMAGLRLLEEVRPAWMALGLAVAALGLAEWTGARGTERGTVHVPLLVAAAATAGAMGEPSSGFVAACLLTAWATWRRLDEPDWLPARDPNGLVAGIGTVAMTATAAWWTDPSVTLVAAAAIVALVALAAAAVPAIGRDPMCRWWPPSAAGALVATTVVLPWNESTRTMVATAIVAGLAACALAVSRLPVAARVWATGGTALWSLVATGEAAGLSLTTEALALAGASLVAVAIGAFVDRPATAQVAAMGHVGGIVAIGLTATREPESTITVATLAVTWWALALLHELHRVAHFERLLDTMGIDEPANDAVTDGSPVLAAVHSIPVLTATAATTAVAMLQLPASTPWTVVPIGAAGALLALGAHLPWRRASGTVLAWAGLAAGAIGVVGPASQELEPWPTITALALALVAAATSARRHPVFLWTAWGLTGPLGVLLLEQTGSSRRWSDVAFAVWGAALLLGSVTVRRIRHGAAAADDWSTPPALQPPLLLGAAGTLLGSIGAMLGEPQWGWVLLGLAGVAMAVAALHPAAVLSVPALVAALVAVVRLVPWTADHPWSLALGAATLAATAWPLQRPDRSPLERWDVAPFVTAHVAAGMALITGAASGDPTLPFLIVAATAAAIAVVCRDRRWWPVHALAAEVLVLATAVHHGPGWLSLACLLSGVALTVTALVRLPHSPNPAREVMLAAGTLFVGGSWASFVVWRDLSVDVAFVASSAISASVVVACALAVRLHVRPRDLFAIWGGAGLAGLVGSALLLGQPGLGVELAQWTCVGVALVLAAAAALVARELHPALRWVTALLVWGALALARVAAQLEPVATVIVVTALASAAALVALGLHALRPASPWVGPWLAGMIAVQVTGLAFLDPARTGLAAAVLLVMAAQVVAIATVVGERYVLLLSPLLALTAWLIVAADALRGDPNWFTAPIGLVILVEVAMVRWVRRTREGAVWSADVNGVLVALELVAMSVMVGPMLTRIVTLELWYAVPAILLGVVLTVWGGVTKVRRRAAFGTGTVLLAVVLLVGVPLARVVPDLSGPALWLTVAGMGLVAIVAATMLEQGRSTVRRWAAALDDATHDWEHLDGADTAPRASDGPAAPASPPVARQR